jgi:hypothetical protein
MHSPSKSLPSSKNVSFISSGKQGSGAMILGEEKAAELHLAFSLSPVAGAVPYLSLQII